MDARTPQKPDWGLRLGCGLWVGIAGVVAWAVFHALGWHIPPYALYCVLVYIVYRFIEYRLDVATRAVLELAAEIEKTNIRLDELENSIGIKQRDEPDYLDELRKETFRD